MNKTVTLNPKITWPTEVVIGKRYLIEVDLATEGDWPYSEEEMPVHCFFRSTNRILIEPHGECSVVLHRFGGSYGPAKFLLSADRIGKEQDILLTLVNKNGVTLWVIPMPEITII